MANDLTSNPWVIDTAGATVLTNDVIRLKKIRWVGGTTNAHTVVVQNAAGKVVFESIADKTPPVDAVADYVQGGEPYSVKGLKVPTLSSGKLYIYYA